MIYNMLFRPFVHINEKEIKSYGNKTYFLRGYMLIPKNDTALIDKYKSNLQTYCNLRRDPFPKPYTKSRLIKGFYLPVNYNYKFFTEDRLLDMSKYKLVKIPGLYSGEYSEYYLLNKIGFKVHNISEIVSIINLIMNL